MKSPYPMVINLLRLDLSMKRYAFLMTLLTLPLLFGCASRNHKSEMGIPTPTKRIHALNHRLHLTMKQMDAIKPILDEEFHKKTEIMARIDKAEDQEKRLAKEELADLEWDTYKRLCNQLTLEQSHLLSELLLEEDQKINGPVSNSPSRSNKGQGRRPRMP